MSLTFHKHNGYLEGDDELLPGIIELWSKMSKDDTIIILTAREKKYKDSTIQFLKKNNLRFNHIIFDLPYGERILFNDKKPNGLKTAISINVERNKGFKNFIIQKKRNL